MSQVRAARGLPDDLTRISAGIEDIDDLLAGAAILCCSTLAGSLCADFAHESAEVMLMNCSAPQT